MKLRPAPKAHRRPHSFRPTLKALEARWCPSCTFELRPLAGGHNELLIHGDNTADSLQIIHPGAPQKGKADRVEDVCPSDGLPAGPTEHAFDEVAPLGVQ